MSMRVSLSRDLQPSADEADEFPDAAQDTETLYASGDIHILVLDDDELIGRMIDEALSPRGFRVDVVSDTRKVEARLTRLAYQVIILDYVLPGLETEQVLEWIREQPSLPSMVLVVLTASSLDEDIERAYRLGANSYVVKPSSREKLVSIVKDFGNWWFKHNEPPPKRVNLPVEAVA